MALVLAQRQRVSVLTVVPPALRRRAPGSPARCMAKTVQRSVNRSVRRDVLPTRSGRGAANVCVPHAVFQPCTRCPRRRHGTTWPLMGTSRGLRTTRRNLLASRAAGLCRLRRRPDRQRCLGGEHVVTGTPGKGRGRECQQRLLAKTPLRSSFLPHPLLKR